LRCADQGGGRRKRAEVFIDAACEAELERALGYESGKKFTLARRGRRLPRLSARWRAGSTALPEAERAQLPACRDRTIKKFLEAAARAGAGVLVTKGPAPLGSRAAASRAFAS